MKLTDFATIEHPNWHETKRDEHEVLKHFCPACHATIRIGEKPCVGDLLLCWNCDELIEIISESPLMVIRVFDDPLEETSFVTEGITNSKFSFN